MFERDDDLIERREFLGVAAAAVAGLGGLSAGGLRAALAHLGRSGGPLANRDGHLDAVRPFNMIVLGDSVMWGQGLEDSQKFSTAVQQWVQAQFPGIEIRREVFAHSGAVIGPDGGDNSAPSPPKSGELPTGVPSVAKQMEMAKTWFRPDQVDLVLMNGGANDVGLLNTILNTDPTVSAGWDWKTNWVGNLTHKRAVERMAMLLPNVASTFSAATIVVTGYYPFVSNQTDWDPMYSWINAIGWMPAAWVLKTAFEAVWVGGLHDKWTQNCFVFDTVVRDGQQKVVDDLNRQLGAGVVGLRPADNIPTGEGLPAGHNYQPPASHPAGRIVFVTVPFAPENSYGTPNPGDTWLWTYGDQLLTTGGVAENRRRACKADGRTGKDLIFCQEASAGHPNIEGARKYAEAIIAALGRFVPQWRTRIAAEIAVKAKLAPRAHTGVATTVTVQAQDGFGKPLHGTVHIEQDPATYSTDTPIPYTFHGEPGHASEGVLYHFSVLTDDNRAAFGNFSVPIGRIRAQIREPGVGESLTTVTVTAVDAQTGAPVPGAVVNINDTHHFPANAPFSYTLKCRMGPMVRGVRQRLCDEVIVSAPDYIDAQVRWGGPPD